jgi:hypothetical protein
LAGAEAGAAEIEDETEVSDLTELDRGSVDVVEAKILDDEISVSETSDWDC